MAEVTETARARVRKLLSDWDWPDPAILDDILALGDEAVPALDELLTPELLALSQTEEREDSVVYYAMELLSRHWERPDARPHLPDTPTGRWTTTWRRRCRTPFTAWGRTRLTTCCRSSPMRR